MVGGVIVKVTETCIPVVNENIMATGGEVAGSREQRSDVVHDYTCSTCSKSDQTRQASHYCPECDVCYCKLCRCDHAALGRSNVEQWGKAAGIARAGKQLKEDNSLKCLRHPQNDVELYCVDHDVVCCRLCQATQHRSCLSMEKICVAAEQHSLNEDIRNISNKIDRLKTKAGYLDEEIEIKKQFTESSQTNYSLQLLEMKTNINAKFDTLVDTSGSRKQQLPHAFTMDQVICTDFKDKVPNLKKELEPSPDKSANFIKVKITKEVVNDTYEKITGILGNEVKGVFKNLPLDGERKLLEVLTTEAHFKMSGLIFLVRVKEDKVECEIVGICQIGNGHLVLADKANTRLKQLNREYTVINHYELQETPNDVCAVDDTEVAVALGTEFKFVRSLKMPQGCLQVAYHDATFFFVNPFSYNKYVYICDKNGKNIARGCWLQETVQCVEISQDGPRIYVIRKGLDHIISLDPKGNKIAEYSHHFDMMDLSSDVVRLCSDDSGNLFVCKRQSREVIMLSQAASGHLKSKPTTVLSLADRDTEPGDHKLTPKTICYDRKLGRIVVGTEIGDYIYLE